MSKSKGNIINPSEIYNKYGSDTLRLYILFIGPADSIVDWNDKGVEGSYRFLGRFYRIITENIRKLEKSGFLKRNNAAIQKRTGIIPDYPDKPSKELARKLHQTCLLYTSHCLAGNALSRP